MQAIDQLAVLLWTQIWQITLLLTVVAATSVFLRHKYPQFVYVLWAILFIKCLTPPIMLSPVGVFAWVDSVQLAPVQSECPNCGTDAERKQSRLLARLAPDNQRISGPAQSESDHVVPSPVPENLAGDISAVPLPQMKTPWPIQLVRGLTMMWLAVIVLLLAWSVVHWCKIYRRIQAGRQSTPDWLAAQLTATCRQMGVKRTTRVIVSSARYGPLVFGIYRPVLVIPDHFTRPEFRRDIGNMLAHEICHLRRGDTLVSVLQYVAQVVYWFHPGIWWANRQANRLCELCCDYEAMESINCKPRDYARSLLHVVDAKRKLRPVLATSAIKPAEVTEKRLRSIMQGKLPARKTPVWCWLIAVLVLLFVLPAAGTSDSVLGQDDDDKQVTMQQARQVLGQGRFAEASEMYQQLVDDDEDNALAWHYLGYSLHAQGKLDEALRCHQKAATFEETKALGLYNWACVLALQGQPDESMDKLEESIAAGLQLRVPIMEDSDFDSLHDDERFQSLVAKLESDSEAKSSQPDADTQKQLRQFDFWIGHWKVVDRDGHPIGQNEITLEESGNLIREKWESKNGTTGQSINFYDPRNRVWKQTWVDSQGRIMETSGRMDNGVMIMKGHTTLPNGKRGQCLIELEPLEDGRVRQFIKISKDDGETWEVHFSGYYHKVEKDDS